MKERGGGVGHLDSREAVMVGKGGGLSKPSKHHGGSARDGKFPRSVRHFSD